MNVPLLDLRPQYETLRSELLAAIEQVIDSQQFVLGPAVTEFEKEIGGYLRVKQAIGCGSGSDALLLALMACDVKAGDEIITTPFTFFATGGAIARMSARPVFVDIDPRTYTLNPALVEGAISSRTRAILPVHLYGQCADMDRLAEIAARHDLPIIEDAAQAIGAEHRGQRAGSMGIIGCFSFYPSKNLGAAGDAGLLTTNDDEIANRLRKLRVHGGAKEYHHLEVGINSRLDSLQAAILRVKLRHLDSWSDARRHKAARYDELFADAKLEFELTPPLVRADGRHIFHQYVVRVPNHRDELMAYLDRHGIGTRVYYPIPLHLQECFKYLGYREGDFPHSEAATRETMALPCYPEMSDEQQEYVVETIGAFNPNQ